MSIYRQLSEEQLPGLVGAYRDYFSWAVPHSGSDQLNMLAELRRRINQASSLVASIYRLEGDCLDSARLVIEDPSQAYGTPKETIDDLHLATESFYWVAHRALSVANAAQKNYPARLPSMPEVKAEGVTNVRNWFIEHQWSFNHALSIDGLRNGPVLAQGRALNNNGKVMHDGGLYLNAAEWARNLTTGLQQASVALAGMHGPARHLTTGAQLYANPTAEPAHGRPKDRFWRP